MGGRTRSEKCGLSYRAIGRQLGIDHHTAKKYAVATHPPTYPSRRKRANPTGDGLAENADLKDLDTGNWAGSYSDDGIAELMALTS